MTHISKTGYCTACVDSPRIVRNGWAEGQGKHSDWHCPICHIEWWLYDDPGGSYFSTEPKAKWPETDKKTEIWELQKGVWKKGGGKMT